MIVNNGIETVEGSSSLRDEGFKRLLEEEASSPSRDDGWEMFSKSRDCEVWRRADSHHKAGVVKGQLTFRGIPPSAVRHILIDLESWNNLDPGAPVVDVLETHKQYKVVHWQQIKFPFSTKPRDMLHKISLHMEEDSQTSYLLYQHMADHPLGPLKENAIRMETHFLGVIIRPHIDYPNSSSLTLVMHVDIKSWVPKFMANKYMAKAPQSWHAKLTDYFWNVYSKHKKSGDGGVAGAGKRGGNGGELSALEMRDALLNQSVMIERRMTAMKIPTKNRLVVEKMCAEVSELAKELEALQGMEEVDGKGVQYYTAAIRMKLEDMEREMQSAMATMVVENFKDPLAPLNALLQAALSTGESKSEECYHAQSEEFEVRANMMAHTATSVATCKLWPKAMCDSKTMEDLCHAAKQMKRLAKQTVCASRLVFADQSNQDAKESFQALKEDYQEKVEKLTAMVDAAVPRVEFLRIAEKVVKAELETAVEQTRSDVNPGEAFSSVVCAANTANRVVGLTRIEANVCKDDESYVETLELRSTALTEAIALVFIGAHAAITQTDDDAVQEQFEGNAHTLVTAIQKLFETVEEYHDQIDTANQVREEELNSVVEVPRDPIEVPRDPIEVPRDPIEVQSEAIEIAAIQLKKDAKQWESKNNGMVEAATRMAALMMTMARYTRNKEVGSKKKLIELARKIAAESQLVVELAIKVAAVCTNVALKKALSLVVSKLQTISTQLKIITAVKDSETQGPIQDEVALEMLTENAQNLMSAVSEALYVSESATIRVPIEERNKLGLKWVKTRSNVHN